MDGLDLFSVFEEKKPASASGSVGKKRERAAAAQDDEAATKASAGTVGSLQSAETQAPSDDESNVGSQAADPSSKRARQEEAGAASDAAAAASAEAAAPAPAAALAGAGGNNDEGGATVVAAGRGAIDQTRSTVAGDFQMPANPAKSYPFTLDPFQRQAVGCLERNESVMVAAHTSAGKTVVAEYAIAMALRDKQRVIYTSPIKALSNQKYRDLYEEFGDVGLLTGDVTIAPNSSCLVMTTEILRSMLYRGSDLVREVKWVIFDEIHYMRDKERGVVWEESIILLPDAARFVFLSATIPNAKEFASWVGGLHNQHCQVIYTDYRPTPLQHFLFPQGGDGVYLVVDEKGKFRQDNFEKCMSKLMATALEEEVAGAGAFNAATLGLENEPEGGGRKKKRKKRGGRGAQSDLSRVIKMVMDRKLDPVIIFSFSKRECETYATDLAQLDFAGEEEKELIEQVFKKAIAGLSEDDRQLPQVKNILPILMRGIGIHHGGLLPILKEIVEILFQESLIKILFATETFAMGINMPAKTVVFTASRKFDGETFRLVRPGEYIQMSGRAGRRGLDDRGIVISMVDEKLDPKSARSLLMGEADPLNSSFHLGYNMLLNLMLFEGTQTNPTDIMNKSFYQFQQRQAVPMLEAAKAAREGEAAAIDVPDEETVQTYFDQCVQLERRRRAIQEIVTASERVREKYFCGGRVVRVVDHLTAARAAAGAGAKKGPGNMSDAATAAAGGATAQLITAGEGAGEALVSAVVSSARSSLGLPPGVVGATTAQWGQAAAEQAGKKKGRHAHKKKGKKSKSPEPEPEPELEAAGGAAGAGFGAGLIDWGYGLIPTPPPGSKEDTVHVLLACDPDGPGLPAAGAGDGAKKGDKRSAREADGPTAGLTGMPRPCPQDQLHRAEWLVLPVLASLITDVAPVCLQTRRFDLNSGSGRRKAGGALLRAVRLKTDLRGIDPVKDMLLDDPELATHLSRVELLRTELAKSPLLQLPAAERVSRLQLHERKVVLGEEARLLQREITSAGSPAMFKVFGQMRRVLTKLGHVSKSGVVQDKGKVTCKVNAADELLVTELILTSKFSDKTPAQVAALLSCMVFTEASSKTKGASGAAQQAGKGGGAAAAAGGGGAKAPGGETQELPDHLAGPFNELKEAARHVASISSDQGIPIEVDDYVNGFNPGMMEVVYSWVMGSKFRDVCSMTDSFEGTIIRVIRRLEELLRQLSEATREIGDEALAAKFQEASMKMRRDIVFAASLYL